MEKLESKLDNLSTEDLAKNAQHVWKMLDDLATNNPSAYRKFIDKQMKQAKEGNEKPKPHMCIVTKFTAPCKSKLFINVFDWTRIPEPKTDQDAIPIIGSSIYFGKDESGKLLFFSVSKYF